MTRRRVFQIAAACVAIAALVIGGWKVVQRVTTKSVTAYFTDATGIFAGDNVLFLGVKIGSIDSIKPDGDRMRIDFRIDSKYKVPADAKAVILSPTLVSARSIQLTPAYNGGPVLENNAVIDQDRTAVPVEWDDFRKQLEHLADSMKPTTDDPHGPFGRLIDSADDAFGGRGEDVGATITKLSKAMTTLADGRTDIFATVRNLQLFVSALKSSDAQIVQLNDRLASVSNLMNNTDNEMGGALATVDAAAADIQRFISENRDGLKDSVAKLASVTTALNDSKPVIEQLLHVAPNAFSNFYNIYQPAQGTLTGALAFANFANPMQFICSAIQAASQKGADESARLCVQYLMPLIGNLSMNFPPVGINPLAGVQARPDQVDYSQPSLRPAAPAAPAARPKDVPGGTGLPGLLEQLTGGAPR